VFQSLGSALCSFALGLSLVGFCEALTLHLAGRRGVDGSPRFKESRWLAANSGGNCAHGYAAENLHIAS
jgi:hypothetical protein